MKAFTIELNSKTVEIDCSDILTGQYLVNYKNQELVLNRIFIKMYSGLAKGEMIVC